MKMEFRAISRGSINFEGYTLILPAVSVGNVGQLTCDLLISSAKLEKAGYLWSEFVSSVIGSDPFSSDPGNSLTLSIEIFVNLEKKLAVLQQRAPIVPGKKSKFTKELIRWMDSQRFLEVILLTSCHAYERNDEEIQGSPVKFLVQSGKRQETELLNEGILELKQRKTEFGEELHFMPGGGIAKIYNAEYARLQPTFQSIILMIFCSEGDNIPEAVTLAKMLNIWRNCIAEDNTGQVPWVFPASWKHLYGPQQPAAIF